MPYGDFDVTLDGQNNPVETEQMRYLEGFGLPAQQTVSTGATQYLHGDLIRSTMLTTGQGGTAVSAVSYTAFGEVIGTAPDTRYQYAGGWGYETAGFGDDPGLLVLEGATGTTPITLMHVGHRWYDPSIGRFIQRDPIGIAGGLNVYAYVDAEPLSAIDPDGLQRGAQAPFYPPQRGPYYPPGLDPPYVGPDSPESQWGYDPPHDPDVLRQHFLCTWGLGPQPGTGDYPQRCPRCGRLRGCPGHLVARPDPPPEDCGETGGPVMVILLLLLGPARFVWKPWVAGRRARAAGA